MAEFTRTRLPSTRSVWAALARTRALDGLVRTRSGAWLDRCRAAGGFLPHYARLHQAFGAPAAARLLSREIRGSTAAGREPARDIADQDELRDATPAARVTALCLRGYTQNQLLRDIDSVSMANSLEVRVPLLDHRLTDLALSLPDDAKIASGASAAEYASSYRASGAKRILIDAFRDLLPPDLEDQPKRGFGMPLDHWLRTTLRDIVEDTLSERTAARRGLFEPAEVALVRKRFDAGGAPWTHPWLLMITELWCREIIDQARVRHHA
jgi:asparagine synthase (glutamine-hydrolysing)